MAGSLALTARSEPVKMSYLATMNTVQYKDVDSDEAHTRSQAYQFYPTQASTDFIALTYKSSQLRIQNNESAFEVSEI